MSVWTSVIAVAGTLSGGLIASYSARLQQRAVRTETRRAEALGAVSALAKAVADHRAAMWEREDTRLRHALREGLAPGSAAGDVDEAVHVADQASRATRSAVTGPWVQVRVLLPGLAAAADRAVRASFAMHDAPSRDDLDQLRQAAKAAEERFVAAAAVQFDDRRRWIGRVRAG